MELWAYTLTEDERTVLSAGLSPSVSTPLIDAQVGQFLGLFPSLVHALLHARATVSAGLFESGEYTFYKVVGLPPGSFAQDIRIEYDEPELREGHMIAVAPPEIPAAYIRFGERKVIT